MFPIIQEAQTTLVSETAASATEPAEGYDDVLQMIEENRRKNEAKRAAQSARNAEITAAYEARMVNAPPPEVVRSDRQTPLS